MWRSIFLAIGISLIVVGAECLVVEKVVFAESAEPALQSDSLGEGPLIQSRDVRPPEWMPWTLMSSGAVVILYSFTIPRRVTAAK
jgi:hypothetical protein